MISHKHKCIFVHIPKAAGTSIEMVFLDDLKLDMDNRHSLFLGASTNKKLGPRRISHLMAREYVEQHYISQELYNQYYKFAFVREPKSRLFSTYKFLQFNEVMSFDDFINFKLDELLATPKFDFFLKSSYDYLYDSNGNCLVDFIGKFENLKQDFEKVRNELIFINTEGKLKHHNKTVNDNKAMINSFFKKIKNYKTSFNKTNSTELSDNAERKILQLYKNDYIFFSY